MHRRNTLSTAEPTDTEHDLSNGRRFGLVRLSFHDAFERSLRLHRCSLVVGNPGVGKTTTVQASARRLTGREPVVLQGGPSVDIGSFWGRWRVVAGDMQFVPGPLAAALTEGRVLLIEELQAIPVEVLAEVLGLRGLMEIVNPVTRETLVVPDSFRVVATANHESLQCRRHGAILQAFVDDFMVHVVPDPTRDQLREILRAHFPAAPAATVQRVLSLYEEYRGLAKDKKHAAARFSVRAAMHLLARLLDGEDEHTAVDVSLVGKFVFDADLHSSARLRLDVAR